MLRFMPLKIVGKLLMPGVFAAVLAGVLGLQDTSVAAQGQRLWSIVVHFQYEDGFEFDTVLERGVPASRLGAALADCGRSHSTPSVVRYQCYPVAE